MSQSTAISLNLRTDLKLWAYILILRKTSACSRLQLQACQLLCPSQIGIIDWDCHFCTVKRTQLQVVHTNSKLETSRFSMFYGCWLRASLIYQGAVSREYGSSITCSQRQHHLQYHAIMKPASKTITDP